MSMTRRRLLDDTYKQTAVGNPIQVRSVARMRPEITMQGWTEQKKTTGAQLLDVDDFETGKASGTSPYSWMKFKYYLTEGETYTITNNGSTPITFKISYGQGEYASYSKSNFTGSYSFTMTTHPSTPEGSELAVFIWAPTISELDELIKIVQESNIMLNEGSTALPYEPYTGGAPSPSPDYPQEIVSAGAWDGEEQKYKYEIKVTGKNILSIPDITPDTPERSIKCNISKDITISAQEAPISISSNIWRIRVKYLDGTLLYFADIDFLSLKPKTFYASEENPIIAITYRPTYITEGCYGGIQVEYGTEATAYEPYKSQDVTLTSDCPLTEWDRLERRDGVWGWAYKCKEITLDGTEKVALGEELESVAKYLISYAGFLPTSKGREGFCNYLRKNQDWNDDYESFRIGQNNADIYLFLDKEKFPDSAFVQEWLAEKQEEGKPVKVLTYGEEETFEPLSEQEQAALNALHTNYPTTVLSSEQRCDMSMIYKTRKSLEVSE